MKQAIKNSPMRKKIIQELIYARELPKVLLVLHSEGEGVGKTDIRIVTWSGRSPVLEKKRHIISPKNHKEILPLKHVGLTLADLEFIVSRMPEIRDVMRSQ